MKIVLLKLILQNFKGIKKLTFKFNEGETLIFGANRSGKTTLHDSFQWLLFDKDSTGRKDFEIKTLTKDGKTIKDLEHMVEGHFLIDDIEVVLKKVYREKWTRKRGATAEEFTGNETTYFWNEVPVKKDEYSSKIEDIISSEETFRLITDMKYFNGLTWQNRRQLLFSLIDEKQYQPDSPELIKRLKGKTTDELKRELNASKKKLLDEIDKCPIRIDEVTLTLKDEIEVDDIKPIEIELESIDGQLSSVDTAIGAFNVARTTLNTQKAGLLDDVQTRTTEIKNSYRNKVASDVESLSGINIEIETANKKLRSINNDIEEEQKYSIRHENDMTLLRNKYAEEQAKEFSGDLKCPTCGTAFEEKKKQTLINNFNENKSKVLEDINKMGMEIKEKKDVRDVNVKNLTIEKTEVEAKIKTLTTEALTLETKINNDRTTANVDYVKEIEKDPTLKELYKKIAAIDKELSKSVDKTDNSGLINRKNELLQKQKEIHTQETNNEQRKEKLQRIEEIEKERLEFLETLSGVEKLEFELSEFIKRKVEGIEKSLYELFNGVEFKMFDPQINGGLNDTCVVQRDGVPFNDLNTASKVWVSLNIISVFSKIKDIYAPIFIDNRESVTELPSMYQQTISLIVSPEHKILTIKK